MSANFDLRAIAAEFQLYGEFRQAVPYGRGHINDTYSAELDQAGSPVRYILQRINHQVFKNPGALMENVQRVTSHLRYKLAGGRDWSRRALTLVPTGDGRPYYRDTAGNYWRTYLFIEHAKTYEVVESPRQAWEAARAFGRFQEQLSDLPGARLHDTIPGFHDAAQRFAALETVIAQDPAQRVADAQAEIEFAQRRCTLTRVLPEAHLPERVTHNDTKFNNVMLDDTTGEAVCVIDLDTVMPGLVLYDFGDLVRTTTSPAPEDERDLTKVGLQFPMFEALARGYLSSAAGFLTEAEKHYLAFAGKLITFVIGIRFLADFLAGDVYFKTHRPNHNLDRCRTQFRLVECIEQQESKMQQLVESL